jgi:hypothetical protein
MQFSRRLSMVIRITAVTTVVFGASLVRLSALSNDPTTVDQRAQQWVEAHKASLPATLSELSLYPSAYRMAVFNALPERVRWQMVNQHAKDLLGARTDLTVPERQFLENTRTRIQGALDSATDPAAVQQASAAACGTAPAVFSRSLREELGLQHLGDYTRSTFSIQATVIRTAEWSRSLAMRAMPAAARHQGIGNTCNCLVSDDGYCEDCQDTCVATTEFNPICVKPKSNAFCTDPYFFCFSGDPAICDGLCHTLGIM